MKENAIRLYKHDCEMAINPSGVDQLERENVRAKAIKSKAEWEARFKTAAKYRNDPEIQELIGIKKEIKEDVKKPTRLKPAD